MSVTLTVEDAALRRALSKFAQMKNKTDAEVVNKAMRYWLPFAATRIIKKTPGQKRVTRDLMARAKNPKKSNNLGRYNNTVAAAIIFDRLKKSGRPVPVNVVEKIDNFFNAKNNSVNFLRAGFIPAYKLFKVPPKGNPKNQTIFKNRSQGKLATESAFFKVEAFARNAREGATKLAPEAFREALPEVTAIFIKFMNQDLQRIAKSTGFA
jgi:hypothetical protein